MFAVPNGMPVFGPGKFAIITAFRKRGLKAGVPDVFLPAQRTFEGKRYAGLFIELKRLTGSVERPEQTWWLEMLSQQGYYTAVCRGCKHAAELIMAYLMGGRVC
jgi:hypothetical protein